MKRLLTVLILALVLMTTVMSASAWDESWVINPSGGGTWKKSPTNHTMPDSGSWWKAKYVSGNWGTSQAYIYKQGVNRVTHIEDFPKGTERTALEYLSGMKVVGDTYWIVASNKNNTTVRYDYAF